MVPVLAGFSLGMPPSPQLPLCVQLVPSLTSKPCNHRDAPAEAVLGCPEPSPALRPLVPAEGPRAPGAGSELGSESKSPGSSRSCPVLVGVLREATPRFCFPPSCPHPSKQQQSPAAGAHASIPH